jgi:hypothetical protein
MADPTVWNAAAAVKNRPGTLDAAETAMVQGKSAAPVVQAGEEPARPAMPAPERGNTTEATHNPDNKLPESHSIFHTLSRAFRSH